MTESKGNFAHRVASRVSLEEPEARCDIDGGSHPSTPPLTYDEKRLVKKGKSIIKLAFYSAGEQIERRFPPLAGGGGEEGGSMREEAEYKVTSHVYFVPVDPIKVPIIISDVFRCNMFDLVSDIL